MLILLHVALGFILGWLSPAWAIAVLVGGVAVSSSVWWQLGLGNIAAPLAYICGFLLGAGLRVVVSTSRREPEGVRPTGAIVLPATLTVGFVLAATLLSVIREHAVETLPIALRTQAGLVFEFNAGGLAGELQAALIAVVGPLLLLASAAALSDARARRLAVRGILCGATFAVSVPILQWLVADPWIRPDKNGLVSTGLVGSFQDPHSLAAYLLLVIGVAAAVAVNAARAGRRPAATAAGSLTAAMVAVLLGTNSKSGIIALVVVGACLLAARQHHRTASGVAGTLLVPGVAVATVLVVLSTIVAVAPLRRGTHDALRSLGATRMAQAVAPDADWNRVLGFRPLRWATALDVAARRPLWGAGPRSIEKIGLGDAYDIDSGEMKPIPPENAHNYFLQFAAEYGLPAAAALLWLLVQVVATTARAVGNHPSRATRTMLTGLLAGQVGFLVFGLVAHPMLLAEGQATFWTLCGLGLSSAQAEV